jgi:hypothetical protein
MPGSLTPRDKIRLLGYLIFISGRCSLLYTCKVRISVRCSSLISVRRVMRFLAVALLAASASAVIKVGDTLPSVTLDFGFPPEKVNLLERAKGKNIILMGLPGAFTPT